MTKPPSPRRCERILQAHCLRCQGLTLRQIAARMGCSHSTVSTYLRDFQLHRQYILETFAAGQLINQLHQLVQPGQDPQQHQQQIAAARELRLLLTAFPKIQAGQERQRQQSETDIAIAIARSRQPNTTGPDGHARLEDGRCALNCPMCRPDIYEARDARLAELAAERLNIPEQSRQDDVPSPQFTPEPEQFRPNPNKPDHPEPEFPVPNNKSAPPARDSRPQPKIGPQYPASWDNPVGYRPAGTRVYESSDGVTRVVTRDEPAVPPRRRRNLTL